jgi:hypothetical protein
LTTLTTVACPSRRRRRRRRRRWVFTTKAMNEVDAGRDRASLASVEEEKEEWFKENM